MKQLWLYCPEKSPQTWPANEMGFDVTDGGDLFIIPKQANGITGYRRDAILAVAAGEWTRVGVA